MDLREQIARALIEDVSRQTDGQWPHDGSDGLCILIDDHIDFADLADRILELPAFERADTTNGELLVVAEAIMRIADSIPAPNNWTPELMMLATSLRARVHKRMAKPALD